MTPDSAATVQVLEEADSKKDRAAAAMVLGQAVVELVAWLPEEASHGEVEVQPCVDWTDCLLGRLLREVPSGRNPVISRGGKVGMCSAALANHGRTCSRTVLDC